MNNALYIGSVVHLRSSPRVHKFQYGAFWLLLDLDSLDALSSRLRLFSFNLANLFSLYTRDHGDGSETPLKSQIEAQLRANQIDVNEGRVFLLCMPRMFGHCFNPLSVYFCCRSDQTLTAIVYEVHNTFGERHSYVSPVENPSKLVRQSCRKSFFVSPFLDMDMRYEFRAAMPNDSLKLAISTKQEEHTVLFASMIAKRKPLNDYALLLRAFAMPFITWKVVLAIRFEALRLWLKGLRTYPHTAPHRQEVDQSVEQCE